MRRSNRCGRLEWLEKAEDPGGEQRRQDGVQRHAEAGKGASDRMYLKGPCGTDAVAGNAGGKTAGAPVFQAQKVQERGGDHRASDAGQDHQHGGQGGGSAKAFRDADGDRGGGGFGRQSCQQHMVGPEGTGDGASGNEGDDGQPSNCDVPPEDGQGPTGDEVQDGASLLDPWLRCLSFPNSAYAEAQKKSERTRLNPLAADFVDKREDRVVVYATITRELSELTYRIKAINQGTFMVPPAFAEGMYDRSKKYQGRSKMITVLAP